MTIWAWSFLASTVIAVIIMAIREDGLESKHSGALSRQGDILRYEWREKGIKEERQTWRDKFEQHYNSHVSPEGSVSFYPSVICSECQATDMIPLLASVTEKATYKCQGVTTKGTKTSIELICLKCANKHKAKLTKWEGV